MRFRTGLSAAFLAGASAVPAFASFHTFKIDEVYSNPSGTIQFIELHEAFGLDGQNFVTFAPDIKSSTHDFMFPSNLPSTTTAFKDFLLGTSAYAALPGVPAPDYIIPASFFNPAGDTLQYGTPAVDSTSFGALPTNPADSLNRVGTSGSTFTVGAATPQNFAGASATLPEPAALLPLAALAALSLRRRR